MSKKNILYIEDNRDTASAVKIILEGAGCNVELAYTGKTGLKIAKNGFDLFLLDIMLPDMSGWDIFEKLKNTKSKFVFLSVIPVSKERIRELKKVGISDYITKPFVKEDLIKRVQKILKS
ncbi:MAG TPA: response regulator [Nanoarchaeota archaeon]|nr:response regulator [Nanoarchaeota archaeon]HIH62840.1 response regulator [Nanoarchaeota archaeon]HIJ10022.1 response regulator [Nanoarchaeota archaeon]